MRIKTLTGDLLPAGVPIPRTGSDMVGGMLKLMSAAKAGHIDMYRDEETLEPREYFCKPLPAIHQRSIYIFDSTPVAGALFLRHRW